jgi:hypothetical protein
MVNMSTFVVPLGVVRHTIITKKQLHCLIALVNANYKFIAEDVAAYGRNSHENIFAKSTLGKLLERGPLHIPTDR